MNGTSALRRSSLGLLLATLVIAILLGFGGQNALAVGTSHHHHTTLTATHRHFHIAAGHHVKVPFTARHDRRGEKLEAKQRYHHHWRTFAKYRIPHSQRKGRYVLTINGTPPGHYVIRIVLVRHGRQIAATKRITISSHVHGPGHRGHHPKRPS